MSIEQHAGILLAGGYSRRMGQDKALLMLPGSSDNFLQRQLHVLSLCCAEILLIVRDKQQAERYAPFVPSSVQVITDQEPGGGPLIGLYSGLSVMRSKRAFVTAVDTPLLQVALITLLLQLALDERPVIPVFNNFPQVLHAVYPGRLTGRIETLLQAGRRDMRALLDAEAVQYIEEETLRTVDTNLRSFANINEPDDLKKLGG